MRAAVFEGPGRMAVKNVPDPNPRENEVLVSVRAFGICGSEVEAYAGTSASRRPPLILGHELAGTVDDDGDGVLYVVNPLRVCGVCVWCVSERSNLCPSRSLMSMHRDGAGATRVVARRAELLPVRSGVDATAAATAEPAATALHALDIPGGCEGKTVLVIGCGSLGLLTVQLAIRLGAARVIATDLLEARLDLAERYGARAAKRLTLDDSADVVLDMVGTDVTRALAVSHCRPGGHVRLVGLHRAESLVDFGTVVRRGLQLEGIYAYRPVHLESAIRFIEGGTLNLDSMVTVGSLDEVPRFYETLVNDPARYVKVVIRP